MIEKDNRNLNKRLISFYYLFVPILEFIFTQKQTTLLCN